MVLHFGGWVLLTLGGTELMPGARGVSRSEPEQREADVPAEPTFPAPDGNTVQAPRIE